MGVCVSEEGVEQEDRGETSVPPSPRQDSGDWAHKNCRTHSLQGPPEPCARVEVDSDLDFFRKQQRQDCGVVRTKYNIRRTRGNKISKNKVKQANGREQNEKKRNLKRIKKKKKN